MNKCTDRMEMRRSLRFAVTVLLTVMSLTSSACGDLSGLGELESQGDKAPPTFGPSPGNAYVPFDLHNALATLKKLRSYYSEFDVTWDGARDDVRISGRLDMERIQVRDPATQEIFATVSQAESGERSIIALVQIGDRGWLYHQGQADTWREISGHALGDYADEVVFTPEVFFRDFDLRIDAPSSPSPEKVDGRPIYEYDFDTQNLTSDSVEFREAWGHVVTAAESGYLIELFMSADVVYHTPDGVFELGEIQASFKVSDVDRPFTVEPPRMVRSDIALPPDVTLPDPTPVPLSRREGRTLSSDDRSTFQTEASVAEVAEFYQTAMPEHGWEAFTYDIPLDQAARADTARLRYIKDDEGVAIAIRDEQGVTEVRINFEAADDLREDPCDSTMHCSVLVLTDFPIAPDAEVMLFMSGGGLMGRLRYKTTASADEITKFYTTIMPANGWSEDVYAVYAPEPDTFTLHYARDGEDVAIFIKDAQGVTEVSVGAGTAALAGWGYPGLEDLQITRGFPVAPDARMSRLLPGQLRYQTPHSVAQVVQFYETALPDDGWITRSDRVYNAETAILRYEKDVTTATLMVKQDLEEGSVVWITLYREKESQP